MLKTVGILLVILGASCTGGVMAAQVYRTLSLARRLLPTLELMKSEIAYRRTPLPELMERFSTWNGGILSELFAILSRELGLRQEASVYAIMKKALSLPEMVTIPQSVRRILLNLAAALGQFDAGSQLRAMDLAIMETRALIEQLETEQKSRVRSYCTLGVCAGLALAILAL